jgi:hypothetical protein
MDWRRALVNTVINLQVPYKEGNFLTNRTYYQLLKKGCSMKMQSCIFESGCSQAQAPLVTGHANTFRISFLKAVV